MTAPGREPYKQSGGVEWIMQLKAHGLGSVRYRAQAF